MYHVIRNCTHVTVARLPFNIGVCPFLSHNSVPVLVPVIELAKSSVTDELKSYVGGGIQEH